MALMTRAAFPQQYGLAVNRYLNEVRANFIKDRARTAPQYSQIYRMKATDEEHVAITSQTGFGTYEEVPEGGAPGLQSVQQGFPKTFSWKEYGSAFAVTEKMVRFKKFAQMEKMMESMLIAEANSIELLKAVHINNAFSSSYPTPDGKALCAADHPVIRNGSTISNVFTSTDMSPASAELVLTAWNSALTDDGYPALLGRPRVIIPRSMEWIAKKVFDAPMNYTNANNEPNVIKGVIAEIFPYDWLTLSNSWFLQVAETQSSMNPLTHWWVDKPHGSAHTDPYTGTVTKWRKFFGGEGTTHHIGIMGVQG